ncbi:hypothetical protein K1719_030339 [Acacia pycnantha]|nr:hypothetical protein K1719_030339 [Acacia pycnantha]
MQSRWDSHYKDYDDDDGLFLLRFYSGAVVFVCGIWINVWSDRELLRLKRQGKGYVAPRGGIFELVSCPNYFGLD